MLLKFNITTRIYQLCYKKGIVIATNVLTKSNFLLLYRRHAIPLFREKDVHFSQKMRMIMMGLNGFTHAPVTSSEVMRWLHEGPL